MGVVALRELYIKLCQGILLKMSDTENPADEFDHYNYDQDKLVSGHGGKNRSKKEAEMNTNRHNPGGHERKIVTKLMNTEKNQQQKAVATSSGGDKEAKQ